MADAVVRLDGITIKNFKNVESGQLKFENNRKSYKANILGLYGQNGSGKTALIDAMELLKNILTGMPIPSKFADYINVDATKTMLQYIFAITEAENKYEVYYDVEIKAEKEEVVQNTEVSEVENTHLKAVICSEVLSYSFENSKEKFRKAPLIDTNGTSKAFSPVSKYNCLVGKANKEVDVDLIVAKKVAGNTSRSFIFSRELLTAIRSNTNRTEEFQRHLMLLESLVRYGNFELFVINTANTGIISLNALPLAFKYENEKMKAVGNLMIPLDRAVPIPEEEVAVVKNVIKNMNTVLSQLVPGLTIGMKTLESIALKNGKAGIKIQLMSEKNEKEIPLKYESEGIKKIISILQLLIVVYNRSSITVAIDELDAGVFEYLLGEMLRIISEKGKGQLIFTSHNLRPLETLDRGFIAFTTTNPMNRYIRMSNIKDNNNLRDFYFRDIVLGEQNEEVYKPTSNPEIALAFREAGGISGT